MGAEVDSEGKEGGGGTACDGQDQGESTVEADETVGWRRGQEMTLTGTR